jgi:hypothetical protein
MEVEMTKAFLFSFLMSVVLLISISGHGFQSRQKNAEQSGNKEELELFIKEIVDATPIQLGVLTEQQRKHSKLYTHYKEIRRHMPQYGKISDFFLHPQGKVMGTHHNVGLGPVLDPDTPENYFGRLSDESDAIIRGKAIKKTSQITEDDSFIFTDYIFFVTEVIKNNPVSPIQTGAKVTVTRPGGKVVFNGIIVTAINEAYKFLPLNRELVLFLKYVPEIGAYQATNYTGAFEVDKVTLKPLTGGQFPPNVLQSSDAFMQTVRSLSKK